MSGTGSIVEDESQRGLLRLVIELLRENGLYMEFMVRDCDIRSFLDVYGQKVSNLGFKTSKASSTMDDAHQLDMLGSKLKATLFSIIPGGELLRPGMRLGADLNVVRHDNDIAVTLAVLPYNSALDETEEFWLSQTIFERITDNVYCRETFEKLEKRLNNSDLKIEPGIPQELKEMIEASMFTYRSAANAYELSQTVQCTKCNYEFGAHLWVDSNTQETTTAKCPNCSERFEVKVEKRGGSE